MQVRELLDLLRSNVRLVVISVFLLLSSFITGYFLNKSEIKVVKSETSAVETGSQNDPNDDSSNTEENKYLRNAMPDSVYIDVSGAVNMPSVYEVPKGSVAGEVIDLAGGVANDASAFWVSKYFDLSKELNKNQKLYIPFEWEVENEKNLALFSLIEMKYDSSNVLAAVTDMTLEDKLSGAEDVPDPVSEEEDRVDDDQDTTKSENDQENESGKDNDTDGKVDVNNASLDELDALPGVGPAYAEKIKTNRPYGDIDDLVNKSGVPESTIEKFQDQIYFGT